MNKHSESNTILDRLRQRTGYLKSTEVMDILGVSRKTLCGWVQAGEIPAVRIGRDNKFEPVELVLWIEARQLGFRKPHNNRLASSTVKN